MVSFVVGLHICFVLAGILWLAGYFKVRLGEAMPVFVCMLVLVLYGLAMLRHLSWIDGIAGVTVVLSRLDREQKEGEAGSGLQAVSGENRRSIVCGGCRSAACGGGVCVGQGGVLVG